MTAAMVTGEDRSPRCGFCGLSIKWGQERNVTDPSDPRGPPILVCPVCFVEQGLSPDPRPEGRA